MAGTGEFKAEFKIAPPPARENIPSKENAITYYTKAGSLLVLDKSDADLLFTFLYDDPSVNLATIQSILDDLLIDFPDLLFNKKFFH